MRLGGWLALARAESRAFYSVTAIFLRPSSPSQPTKKRDDPQTNYRRLPTSLARSLTRRMSRLFPSSSHSPCSSHSSPPLPRCFVFIMAHVANSVTKEPFRKLTLGQHNSM